MSVKTYIKEAKNSNVHSTPQSQAVPGKNQLQNNAGGYVFTITHWEQLKRFLILGSEGGTYYVGERKLTKDNAQNVIKCIAEDGKRVIDLVVDISDSGRAPKNDPALFVLAMCAGLGNEEERRYALENLSKVARIGTHLFHFAEFVQNFRGWGHSLRNAIGKWYTNRDTDNLQFQLIKYQGRDGWTNKDLIRLSHPKTNEQYKNLALRWAVKGYDTVEMSNLSLIHAFEQVKKATTEKEVVELVENYGLPLEAIPTERQTKKVLAAALPTMGITAIIRNLGRFSKEGLLTNTSLETVFVIGKILDKDTLKKGRVHPLNILVALKTYQSGHGMRGKGEWDVVSKIVDALDEAFYLSFGLVEPTGKRICLALDVSGSMTSSMIGNMNLSAREASSAMAMVTARSEKNYEIIGFTSDGGRSSFSGNSSRRGGYSSHNAVSVLDISPRRRLDDICKYTREMSFGATDCALPMLYASANNLEFDTFITYTDNETWAGNIHPFQALKQYRQKTGIDARLIAVGMTTTEYSIADPSDSGMLDIVGFDTSAPNIMSDFIRGNL